MAAEAVEMLYLFATNPWTWLFYFIFSKSNLDKLLRFWWAITYSSLVVDILWEEANDDLWSTRGELLHSIFPRAVAPSVSMHYTPQPGVYVGRWEGHFVRLSVSAIPSEHRMIYPGGTVGGRSPRKVTLSLGTKAADKLRDKIRAAYRDRLRDKSPIYIGADSFNDWTDIGYAAPRNPDSLFYPKVDGIGDPKDFLLRDLKEFLSPETEAAYRKAGRRYKRVYLLEGPPGTGKSSLIALAATESRSRLYVLRNTQDKIFARLSTATQKIDGRGGIVAMEQIENMLLHNIKSRTIRSPAETAEESVRRDELSDLEAEVEMLTQGGWGFNNLLDALDSPLTPHGMVVIMTTNTPEGLPPALVRPGRVNVRIPIAKANLDTALQYLRWKWPASPNPDPYIEKHRTDLEALPDLPMSQWETFAEYTPGPADLSRGLARLKVELDSQSANEQLKAKLDRIKDLRKEIKDNYG